MEKITGSEKINSLTIRQEFAILILSGMMANHDSFSSLDKHKDHLVSRSVEIADALISKLNEPIKEVGKTLLEDFIANYDWPEPDVAINNIVRVYNALHACVMHNHHIYLEDLTPNEFMKLRNVGKKSLQVYMMLRENFLKSKQP